MFMLATPDIAEQQDRALARLLELGLAAAEKVQARLMATEDDALLADLSLALNRASRNVRQTIALQMRAARGARRPAALAPQRRGPALAKLGLTALPLAGRWPREGDHDPGHR